ncbi:MULTISPECIES: NAD(P)/FAD-dependent oxidoreductase [Mycolicibacterium]|uniref:Glycine/D-amino acid oxidase n=1 Tax=Mycolicibacterium senegalense TaxID=1796 RepID=A0A378W613_9MYCO|nr:MULTISPECIES: FAD-binding oxidoreductase [Mycolicibacterium]MCV7336055.1 FAD-dependent oxidoreductase [Mycolicibacterium senegalense]MDR7287939.1 glycine/D-amino acid oxidase-like deaminating enzyme [Mycolicibacterium senegalense]QZA24939.1 FAD-binding oxidoreductase [Mycolicibacterium senegalense]CDP86634.1 glycine/D-amino acid oxidase [Mycolicibacterium farcinogenes]SUA28485.1 glycine/D-amino acid oxidase [Mycolicibacterium senegalense]
MVARDADRTATTPTAGAPLWRDDRVESARPALDGDIVADVAIVGAGFTGLWTAYYLAKSDPSLNIVVIEREYAGFGASGRNGGWASAIFPVSLAHVAKLYDHDAALRLQRAMNDTVTEIGTVVAAESIDCDYAREGYISLARNDAQLARARATVAGSESFGTKNQWQFLTAPQARDRVNATGVKGAIYTDHCALLQPDKLVRGLAATVESLGVVIYENTAVESINHGVLRTRRGVVTAGTVVRATEAFTPQFAGYRRDVAPLYSLVVATAPIPEPLRHSLGLTSRTAFNDMRNLRIYAHPTADGRLVFGGRGAPYHFGSKVEARFDVDDTIHTKIIATMHEMFPQLRDVPITHRWGGPLGVPRDWFPSVGHDRANKIAWAGPYVGDGVATSNLAARILRNLLLGQRDDLNDLPIVNHRSKKWEVEPFRWLGVNAGLQAAAAADVEERTTNKPSKVSALLESLTGAH